MAEIETTIRGFFEALRLDDEAAFERLTTPAFYSFDGGKRFVGDELSVLVRDAHARGVQLNWSIGTIDAHVRCDIAWAAWENVGSVGAPPELVSARWLESAVLIKQGRTWRIDFFHSSRAAVAH